MKHFKILILSAWAIVSFSACKKFIDKPYDNRIAPATVDQYQQLLTDAYPVRHDLFTDILTDDFDFHTNTAQASNISFYLPIFLWKDDYPDGAATGPLNAYAEYYKRIYYANLALEGIDQAGGTTKGKAAVKGEALLIRAYCHFILVNLFSRHYNATRAGSELGVPLVLKVSRENQAFYSRNTVQEVYDQVEKDAKEGLELLSTAGAEAPENPYHFSVAAANAFLSRIKLYKREWNECMKYADAVIQERGKTVRRLSEDLKLIAEKGEAYFAAMFMAPETHPNILLLHHNPTLGPLTPTGFRLAGFYPSDSILPLYGSQSGIRDLRSGWFGTVGTVIDNRRIAMKFGTQPNSPNNTPIKTPYFTIEEVLLTRAEALLRANAASGITLALEDMEAIRKERYDPYQPLDPAGLSADSLLTLVMLERRKEFINEGMRWYDVKRLGLKIEHRIGRDEAPAATLQPDDLRTALQIPRLEQERNPPLAKQLNPR